MPLDLRAELVANIADVKNASAFNDGEQTVDMECPRVNARHPAILVANFCGNGRK